jgi:uncharacterized membrane protein affecting hemolysin expression
MMNRMAMAMRQQMTQNPQMFAQNALRSGAFRQNPMHQSALQAVANNDVDKIRELTGNLCKEHNVTLDEAVTQYKQYYGLQ